MRYRNTIFVFAAIVLAVAFLVFFLPYKVDGDASDEEIAATIETDDEIDTQEENDDTSDDVFGLESEDAELIDEPEAVDISEPEEESGKAEAQSGATNEADAMKHEESGNDVECDEPAVEEKESLEEIISRYEPGFDALENEAEKAIDTLIEKAKEEYYSVEEDERTIGFKLELANKYLKAGNDLEEDFDIRFYGLLTEFESELLLCEYETSVIDEIADAYKAEKSERRKSLISKAMDKM